MARRLLLKKVQSEIEKGLESCHCDKCGCMINTLNNIQKFLDSRHYDTQTEFRERVKSYLTHLKAAESS